MQLSLGKPNYHKYRRLKICKRIPVLQDNLASPRLQASEVGDVENKKINKLLRHFRLPELIELQWQVSIQGCYLLAMQSLSAEPKEHGMAGPYYLWGSLTNTSDLLRGMTDKLTGQWKGAFNILDEGPWLESSLILNSLPIFIFYRNSFFIC